MFRTVLGQLSRRVSLPSLSRGYAAVGPNNPDIYAPNFDENYEAYFRRTDIDHWELRKGMTDLVGMDLIPEPRIIMAALIACRRLNDYALAVRWLESCYEKCGPRQDVWKWILQEIRPCLNELGVNTPEEMGYGCPELALKPIYYMF